MYRSRRQPVPGAPLTENKRVSTKRDPRSPIDRLNQSPKVADRKRLIRDLRLRKDRRVIQRKRTFEADVAVSLHRAKHVDIAVVDERLLELRKGTPHVAEMNHHDLASRSHVPDRVVHV